MNVWINKARRKALCYYCQKEIETGDFQIICRFYVERGNKRWKKTLHFHAKEPYCWIDRGILVLSMLPPKQVEKRGRKALLLSDCDKKARLLIIKHRANTIHRIKIAANSSKLDFTLVHRLVAKISQLETDIEKFGGAPKSWKNISPQLPLAGEGKELDSNKSGEGVSEAEPDSSTNFI